MLLLGDLQFRIMELDDESVDSVVTDPPYELGFMGKSWDATGIAYNVDVWRECLRVLKPGGHLLAFGGSRTYHRLACAIEDAGFEIRDQIMYLYGTGFPKSFNVNRERGNAICGCSASDLQLRDLRSRENDAALLVEAGQNCDMQPTMQREDSSQSTASFLQQHERPQEKGPESGSRQSRVEGRGDVLPETRELQTDQVCSLPSGICRNGAQGQLRNGASSDRGENVPKTAIADGSCSPPQPRSAGQQTDESRTLANKPKPQIGGAWPLCDRCGKPVVPSGFGTALKPAHEPIVVARKPLIGTVAVNVLEHGTGALNIDACRVPGEPVPINKLEKWSGFGQEKCPEYEATVNTQGRWPANLIHDGSDEVLDAFPSAPGQQGDLKETGRPRPSSGRFGDMPPPHAHKARRDGEPSANKRYTENGATNFAALPGERRLDKGSASRFFYCAKVAPKERNSGCEDLVVWESEDLKSAQTGLNELVKDISEDTLRSLESEEWNTLLSGNNTSDLFQTVTTYITRTRSRTTTELKTLNFSPNLSTSDDILDVIKTVRVSGLNLADCAESISRLKQNFTDAQTQSVLGVVSAVLTTLFAVSVKGKQGCSHPTVKPTELMRYLCRLVTPPGGVVLDPFMGSGSTGKAALLEGFDFIGIEKDPGYYAIAERRCAVSPSVPDLRDDPSGLAVQADMPDLLSVP